MDCHTIGHFVFSGHWGCPPLGKDYPSGHYPHVVIERAATTGSPYQRDFKLPALVHLTSATVDHHGRIGPRLDTVKKRTVSSGARCVISSHSSPISQDIVHSRNLEVAHVRSRPLHGPGSPLGSPLSQHDGAR